MKHETIKLNTKKQLSASLKKLLEEKPLSKITISELANECGLNRKTFYYHFNDVRQLLEWTFKQEAVDIFTEYGRMSNFTESVAFTVEYLNKNKAFLTNVYNSIGGFELTEFFRGNFIEVIEMSIALHEKELGVVISDNFRGFLSSFYSQALTGQMLELLNTKTVVREADITDYIMLTLSVSIPEVIMASVKAGM